MKPSFSVLLLLLGLAVCFSQETKEVGEAVEITEVNKDEEIQEAEGTLDIEAPQEPVKGSSFLGMSSDDAGADESAGIFDVISDVAGMVASIQNPIGQQIDSVWSWFGNSDQVNGEDCETSLVTDDGEDTLEGKDDNKLFFRATKLHKEDANKEIAEETIEDSPKETIKEIVEESTTDDIITNEAASVILENDEVLQVDQEVVITDYNIHLEAVEEIDEIVVTVPYEDIFATISSEDDESVVVTTESYEPFLIRVYELFMGKETELGIHNTNITQSKVQEEVRRLRGPADDAL